MIGHLQNFFLRLGDRDNHVQIRLDVAELGLMLQDDLGLGPTVGLALDLGCLVLLLPIITVGEVVC